MDIDRQLRERGMPLTEMYQRAQVRRNAYLAAGQARRNAMRAYAAAANAAHTGDFDRVDALTARAEQYEADEAMHRGTMGRRMPQAEPDQVVRSVARDGTGQFAGRYEGAIVSGMVDKVDVDQPTNEGSTFQMDLMDMSTRRAESGYGLLAVDTHSRLLYGVLVRDKTIEGLINAFRRLLQRI